MQPVATNRRRGFFLDPANLSVKPWKLVKLVRFWSNVESTQDAPKPYTEYGVDASSDEVSHT